MNKINPVDLFQKLKNVSNVAMTTEVDNSNSTQRTKFVVTKKIYIYPASFHFEKKAIIAFDALLKNYGLECDLEIGGRGKAIFTAKQVEYYRKDGTVDYQYFPSQLEIEL